ncbi:unnamed protein product, partial [Iphiclides podalirius]
MRHGRQRGDFFVLRQRTSATVSLWEQSWSARQHRQGGEAVTPINERCARPSSKRVKTNRILITARYKPRLAAPLVKE